MVGMSIPTDWRYEGMELSRYGGLKFVNTDNTAARRSCTSENSLIA
jgi:hypothetical protein